jgi:hypothetical protein
MAFRRVESIRGLARWDRLATCTGVRGRVAAVTTPNRMSPSPKLLAGPERMAAILGHELSHALLHRHAGLCHDGLPGCFDGGLAVLVPEGVPKRSAQPEGLTVIRAGQRFEPDDANPCSPAAPSLPLACRS